MEFTQREINLLIRALSKVNQVTIGGDEVTPLILKIAKCEPVAETIIEDIEDF